MENLLPSLGFVGALLWITREFTKTLISTASKTTATAQENNKDQTPEWIGLIRTISSGFTDIRDAFKALITRIETDSNARAIEAVEQSRVLKDLSDSFVALTKRLDADSLAARQGYEETAKRIESLTALTAATASAATSALGEVKIMKDDTITRAEALAQQNAELSKMLTDHGLQIEQVKSILEAAAILKDGALDDLVTRLLKARADATPPASARDPTTEGSNAAPVVVINSARVTTDAPPAQPVNQPNEESKPDDQ